MKPLHPGCLSRLREATIAFLESAEVESGYFLKSLAADTLEKADTALPNEVRIELAAHVSEDPFSTFVLSSLQDRLAQKFGYQSDQKSKLTELPGFESVSDLADELISLFQSLPWQYQLIYPLPLKAEYLNDTPEADKEYELSPGVSLVRPGPNFRLRFAKRATDQGLQSVYSSQHLYTPWHSGTLCLVCSGQGYISEFFETQPIRSFRLYLRAFGGLLASSYLTTRRHFFSLAPIDSWIYAYRSGASGEAMIGAHNLGLEHSEVFRSLQWLDVKEVQESQWATWMQHVANRLRPALAANDSAALLRRSAQWYFDSLSGTGRLIQFVQATVALEILLGDKAASDVVGLGELLANRCAYSLASTHGERLELLKSFRKIYDTRSQIVHRGKSELSTHELGQLHELRVICSRLVRKELDLLKS